MGDSLENQIAQLLSEIKKVGGQSHFKDITFVVNVERRRLIVEILSSFSPVLKILGMKSTEQCKI